MPPNRGKCPYCSGALVFDRTIGVQCVNGDYSVPYNAYDSVWAEYHKRLSEITNQLLEDLKKLNTKT